MPSSATSLSEKRNRDGTYSSNGVGLGLGSTLNAYREKIHNFFFDTTITNNALVKVQKVSKL